MDRLFSADFLQGFTHGLMTGLMVGVFLFGVAFIARYGRTRGNGGDSTGHGS